MKTAPPSVSDTASQAGGSAGNRLKYLVKATTSAPNVNLRDASLPNILKLLPVRCDSGNLNGQYHTGPYQAMTDGVVWYTWHGWWYSIKSVVMMIRAADLKQPPAVTGPLPEQLAAGETAGGTADLPYGG